MLTTIDQFIDKARENLGQPSDRAVARALDARAATVNAWRMKKAHPSDEMMIRLARLAGEDQELALLQLNSWRATGQAATLYLDLVKRLSAAAIIGLLFLGNIPRPSLASNGDSTLLSGMAVCTVYYGK